jgi:hypothetical protein
MAQFIQPVNREAQLKTILAGYENVLQKEYWFSEALQKDAIQNSWDAKLNSKKWYSKILFRDNIQIEGGILLIEDGGTSGLIGDIPKDKEHLTSILSKEDPEEKQKLSFFLSQDFSVKAESSLGARGRGKMIFVAASQIKKIYFESFRNTDKRYLFGSFHIDKNRDVQVEIFSDEEALKEREKTEIINIPKLITPGTRILIISPNEKIIEAIENGQMEAQIKETWWEILSKRDAKILIGKNEVCRVQKSPWLPVSNSGIRETENYGPIDLGDGLKIKRISLCFLGEKSIPIGYEGIAIQRRGMCVERTKISSYNPSILNGLIYGSVEFDEKLDDVIKQAEAPEHCSFIWTKSIAPKVKKEIKIYINRFAEKYDILHSKDNLPKQQRAAEIEAQKDLNKLAEKLGFGGHKTTKNKKRKKTPKTPEPIYLSVPDFKTPFENGRINSNQEINGAYFYPISTYEEPLKVLVRVWITREGEFEVKGLHLEKEILISKRTLKEKIGWDNVLIDDRFTKGKYYLRGKIIPLEDKIFKDGRIAEKGKFLYHVVQKPFYVNEDPPDSGFFEVIREEINDKKHYFRWEEQEDGCKLYWNAKHPELREDLKDEIKLKNVIKREGALILVTMLYLSAESENEDIPLIYREQIKLLEKKTMEEKLSWIYRLRSEFMWDS